MLTPEGVIQHIRNGHIFQKAYIEKRHLFTAESPYDQIKVVSTNYPGGRTYQSALAFMYGIFPDLIPRKLHIAEVADNRMCTNVTRVNCDCPKIKNHIDEMSLNFEEMIPAIPKGQEIISNIKEEVAEAMSIGTYDLPSRASPMLSTIFIHICHGFPLPGHKSKCIPPRTVINLFNAGYANGAQHQKEGRYPYLMTLKMMPLLHTMYTSIRLLGQGLTKEKLILYSGHDTTVEPFMTVLGIADGSWPKYATRLVFETYSKSVDGQKQYFNRFLLNGIDVTQKVIFCRDGSKLTKEKLCPFDNFMGFIRKVYPSGKEYEKQCHS